MSSTFLHTSKLQMSFTKSLAKTKFKYFRERLGLVENASLLERECC
jgi:hypothetical protein